METSRVLYISKQLINKTVDSRLCGRDVGMKANCLQPMPHLNMAMHIAHT